MKRLILSFILLCGVLRGADIDFVTDVTLTGNLQNAASGQGMVFTNRAGVAITVTQLGRWNQSGNNESHLIGIYTSTSFSSPAASVTVNAALGTPGTFQYGTLSSPYDIPAGATVYIISSENVGGDRYNAQINGTPPIRNTLTTTDIGTTTSAFVNAGAGVIGNAGGASTSMGPVAFRYTSPVPGWTKDGTVYTTNGTIYSANSAIADASDGDTVNVPATTWNLGGTSSIVINKPIKVMGAGSGSSIININSSTPTYSSGGAVYITAAATFGGFTMNQPGGVNTTAISATSANGWRITDILYNSAPVRGYFVYTNSYGLIDHCYIDGGSGNDEWIFMRGPSSVWLSPIELGTANAVYLEDNTFYDQGYFDANYASSVVARFNTVTPINGIKYDWHGYATNGGHSARGGEIYANQWTTGAGTSFELRGGTGMVFANSTVGTQAFYLTDYGYLSNLSSWGNYQTPNNYPLWEQIGRGALVSVDVEDLAQYQYAQINDPGDTVWTDIGAANNTSGTQFTATGPGTGTGTAYVSTTSEPMYLWGNRQSGGAAPWARLYKVIGTASSFNTNATGYSIGATSINLTSRNAPGSGSGKIGVGDGVLFANHATRYRVTSGLPQNSTSGTITITPALTSALVGSVVMTSGPLTTYQMQTGNPSSTFTEPDIVQSNRDFYADAGFDTNTGVTVGTADQMAGTTAVGKNKQGFWVTDEGSWNHGFTGTIEGEDIQQRYFCEIVTPGSPSFTTIGAKDNLAGTQFLASGPQASGTGTVKPAQGRLYVSDNTNWVLKYTPYIYPHPLQGAFPSVTEASINAAGDTITFTLSVSCTTGSGGAGGVTISASGGASTATYAIGSGSTAYTYDLSRTINFGETVTVSYTQPGNGIEATTGGADLPSFTSQSVSNGSLVGTATFKTLQNPATVGSGF